MEWQTIKIDDTNETFLISIENQSNESFVFNLTNFKELWREEIDWQEILCRAKHENIFMDTSVKESVFKEALFSVAKHYQYSTKADTLLLKTKYYIGGIPFHFQWKLMISSANVFYEEITRKLLVTLLNVQDQRNELIEIVKRKDVEINQYKVEGATIMRKQIATQPFQQSEFDRTFGLMTDVNLLAGNDNCNTVKTMCNYSDLIKDDSVNASNVTEGPSPSKVHKSHKNKEENAMRKFKAKKECKIKYESSCELFISDEEMETEQQKMESTAEQPSDTNAASKLNQCEDVPKRKLKSKLNL